LIAKEFKDVIDYRTSIRTNSIDLRMDKQKMLVFRNLCFIYCVHLWLSAITQTQMLFFATFAFTQAATTPPGCWQPCLANAILFPKPIAMADVANTVTIAIMLTNTNF